MVVIRGRRNKDEIFSYISLTMVILMLMLLLLLFLESETKLKVVDTKKQCNNDKTKIDLYKVLTSSATHL